MGSRRWTNSRNESNQTPQPAVGQSLFGADGNVLGLARAGNTLYMAGSFRSVGENSGGLVAYDTRSGLRLPSFPKVAGSIAAIIPDGAGGWYIGGEFSGVGGKPRSCLAQIAADGSVTDWNPDVSGSVSYVAPPAVTSLAMIGNRVFLGGAFGFIGGQSRRDLGCVDARTGAVLDWIADAPEDGYISALALQGDTLFVGGGFSSLGGVARSSLAALSAVTGEILPWRMDVFGGAYALLAHADTLFVGGDFLAIGGRPQPMLAAVDIPASALLPIDFQAHGVTHSYVPDPRVVGLAKSGDTLYAVGNFDQIGGQLRSGIAAVSASSGGALSWQPDTTGPRADGFPPLLCLSVALVGQDVYVGGYFEQVGGQYHPYVAALDRETGHVRDWTPTPDDAVLAFVASGDTLLVGGYFHLLGAWQHRAGLAALDLTTGRLKPWNPNPDGSVCTAVATSGDRVFVSGDFSTIGGDPQPRHYFAALDTINGEATSWAPAADDLATTFMLAGDTLFAGGYFSQIGGQPRGFAAALDITSGEALPWNPDADCPVLALARSGATIFLGGLFSQVGAQPRAGIAAVDDDGGSLSAWDPGTDNRSVNALVVAGPTLYVGGGFGAIGGQSRSAIAALDISSGLVRPWYPAPTPWGVPSEVKALAIDGGELYVGGAFASLGGQPRICLAAVDTSTASVTSWDPGLDGFVWSLLAQGNALYVGGGFSRAGGIPADDVVAFALPSPGSRPVTSLELAQCFPNPTQASTQIRFSLPRAATATLSIYDIQGRLVSVPLGPSKMNPGVHTVQVRTQGWPAGVYIYALEADGKHAARKIVVVR